MDLSSPLNSLIPTLDAAVLEVLAGTESAFGVSQIQRLARRGARSGVHRVLDRLTEHGLVNAERTNVGYMYSLNREHVLADAVVAASRARHTFLQQLSQACRSLSPKVVYAGMFGSTARRESGPDSDVDLLLVVEDEVVGTDAWEQQLLGLGDRVMAWSGNRLECLVLDRNGLRLADRTGEPIVREVLRDEVALTGVSLSVLLLALRSAGFNDGQEHGR